MNDTDRDGANVRFPPPLVYGIALALGIVLHLFVVPLPLAIATGLRIGIALVLAALAVALLAGALGLFKRTGQDLTPWTSTPEIIASGVYRITRNPMYVGMALLQVAIGIGFGNGWLLVLLPPVLVVIWYIAIRHEEDYLARKFGESYLAYRRSVRRWI